MADSDDHGALTKAFSGLGVDEKTLIKILGKWHPEQRKTFRKGSRDFFVEDERQFERWNDGHVAQLRNEFLRIKEAIVLWTMHPWERDARLLKESLSKGSPNNHQYNILIEVACTRSADELLGARKAYHSLFHRSIEEDVAFHVHGTHHMKRLLIALVSSYRYEGPKVNQEAAKTDANTLSSAIKEGESELLIRVISTRSILHLNHLYKYYKEIHGNYLDEDLKGDLLKETIQCLCIPTTYFTKILGESLKHDADEARKDAVTRVIVTRADHDMKQIKEEYSEKYGGNLANKIEDVANGSYKDFLLTLIARGD
ncbi:annexin D4 isoform X2 [Henckelia pumila]|uniref:annexin D4 isoform X2 n=1 Tax=Henckelia pumila TaxID=405737 RepID=UPI003C6E3ACB